MPLAIEEDPGCPPEFVATLVDALPVLRRTVAARVADPGLRDDVVQDAVERALRSWRSFDPARPMGPWLRRLVVVSVAVVDRADRRAREAASADPGPPDWNHPGCDDHVVRLDECRQVRTALRSLGARDQALLHWRDSRHLSFEETASLAGTTSGGARRAVSRARLRFAAAYDATTGAARGGLVAFGAALGRWRARLSQRVEAVLEWLPRVSSVPAALMAVAAVGLPAGVVVIRAGAQPSDDAVSQEVGAALHVGRVATSFVPAPPGARTDLASPTAAGPVATPVPQPSAVRIAPTGVGAGADLGGQTSEADAIWYQGVELRCDRSIVVGLGCAVLRQTPVGDGAEVTVPG